MDLINIIEIVWLMALTGYLAFPKTPQAKPRPFRGLKPHQVELAKILTRLKSDNAVDRILAAKEIIRRRANK